MFNGKKKEVTAQTLQSEKISSIIAADVTVHGGLTAKDSMRIEGTIEGDVTIEASLILGRDAVINGSVKAANASVAGSVNGNIDAAGGLVTLSDTAKVRGDITTEKIVIDENAYFTGKCIMPEPAVQTTQEEKKEA